MATLKRSDCELRGVKIHRGLSHETVAFTGSLYLRGKKVASVENEGQGGPNNCFFKDSKIEDEFFDWAKSLPPTHTKVEGLEVKMDGDLLISIMVGDIDEERHLKSQCRTKVLFTVKDSKEGEYFSYRFKYTPESADYVKAQNPTLVEIINERFVKGSK